MKKLSNTRLREILNERYGAFDPEIPLDSWSEISGRLSRKSLISTTPQSLFLIVSIVATSFCLTSDQLAHNTTFETVTALKGATVHLESPKSEKVLEVEDSKYSINETTAEETSKVAAKMAVTKAPPSTEMDVTESPPFLPEHSDNYPQIPSKSELIPGAKHSSSGTMDHANPTAHSAIQTLSVRRISTHLEDLEEFPVIRMIPHRKYVFIDMKPKFLIGLQRGFVRNRILPSHNDQFLVQADPEKEAEIFSTNHFNPYISLNIPVTPRFSTSFTIGFSDNRNQVNIESFNTILLSPAQRLLPANEIRRMSVYENYVETISRDIVFYTFDFFVGFGYRPFKYRSSEIINLELGYSAISGEFGDRQLQELYPDQYLSWELSYRTRIRVGENTVFWLSPFFSSSFRAFKSSKRSFLGLEEISSYSIRQQYFGLDLSYEIPFGKGKKSSSGGGSRE